MHTLLFGSMRILTSLVGMLGVVLSVAQTIRAQAPVIINEVDADN